MRSLEQGNEKPEPGERRRGLQQPRDERQGDRKLELGAGQPPVLRAELHILPEEDRHAGRGAGCPEHENRQDPVADIKDQYKFRGGVKILLVPQSKDVPASKAHTPQKLQGQRCIQVAEKGETVIHSLDDVDKHT